PHFGQGPSTDRRVCVSAHLRRARTPPATSAPIAHGAWGGTRARRGAATSAPPRRCAAPDARHDTGFGRIRTATSEGGNPNSTAVAVPVTSASGGCFVPFDASIPTPTSSSFLG